MLANQVASVHADFILSKVKSLTCPSDQKLALIDSIIEKIHSEANAHPYRSNNRTV